MEKFSRIQLPLISFSTIYGSIPIIKSVKFHPGLFQDPSFPKSRRSPNPRPAVARTTVCSPRGAYAVGVTSVTWLGLENPPPPELQRCYATSVSPQAPLSRWIEQTAFGSTVVWCCLVTLVRWDYGEKRAFSLSPMCFVFQFGKLDARTQTIVAPACTRAAYCRGKQPAFQMMVLKLLTAHTSNASAAFCSAQKYLEPRGRRVTRSHKEDGDCRATKTRLPQHQKPRR